MNRKSEGNQRKNFPSKDEIIHIHLKGMKDGARYLPISIDFGFCLADSFGSLTAYPGENKVNDNTVSSPSSNFVSEAHFDSLKPFRYGQTRPPFDFCSSEISGGGSLFGTILS